MEDNIAPGIHDKLMSIRDHLPGSSANLTISELTWLCDSSQQIFLDESPLLALSAHLMICGDTHGQYPDLIRIFDRGGVPPAVQYLFLGDYVDRGRQSIETVSLLLLYKILYPTRVWMLRGNHECSYINRLYGFRDDCNNRYGSGVWERFCELFNYLPLAAVVDDKIFCVHGGLSPRLESLDQIRNIRRPIEVPEEGLLCDLLWADPSGDSDAEGWAGNERGTSVTFGLDVVLDFCEKFGFDLICRGHQAVMEGFEFPFSERKIVTIFSAPNYCYEFDNHGAFMTVDENLFCMFQILEPRRYALVGEERIADRSGTPPRQGHDKLPDFLVGGQPNSID
jgi:serine/threonine-protein phosphatase PP1 catalytic subunit